MSTAYSKDEDDSGIDINDPIVMDDISTQETSDVLEPARKVRFEIKKAQVRTQQLDRDDRSSPWIFKRLALQVAVGPDGVDGNGSQANRRLFPEYLLAFNKDAEQTRYDFSDDYWQKKARGVTKELFAALGYPLNPPPPVTAEFLEEIVGKEFIADILKKAIRENSGEQDEKGKDIWVNSGDFKNDLKNHRLAD
jgi:hypothetical protein